MIKSYNRYYKIVRNCNPMISAVHVLAYLRGLDMAGNLEKAFRGRR